MIQDSFTGFPNSTTLPLNGRSITADGKFQIELKELKTNMQGIDGILSKMQSEIETLKKQVIRLNRELVEMRKVPRADSTESAS